MKEEADPLHLNHRTLRSDHSTEVQEGPWRSTGRDEGEGEGMRRRVRAGLGCRGYGGAEELHLTGGEQMKGMRPIRGWNGNWQLRGGGEGHQHRL